MSWESDNRRFLTDAIGRVRAALEARAASADGTEAPPHGGHDLVWHGDPARPPVLHAVGDAFGLSPFERDVLLLCTGVELDASLAALCGRAGDPKAPFPTFALALAAFPSAHWDALSPSSALRRLDLVEVEPGPVLTQARLRVPARVWQLLLGIDALDELLVRYASPGDTVPPSPSQAELARRAVAAAWQADQPGREALIQLCGRSRASVAAVAAACAAERGLSPLWIAAEALPTSAGDLEQLARVLRREAVLRPLAVVLECHDLGPGEVRASVLRLVSAYRGFLVVAGRQRMALGARAVMSFDVDSPTTSEQRTCWIATIAELTGGDGAGGARAERIADALSGQFDLDLRTLAGAASRAAAVVARGAPPRPAIRALPDDEQARELRGGTALEHALWDACRAEVRPEIEDLAQRIASTVDWEDLVLPEAQLGVLRDVEVFVRRRSVVDAWWGPGANRSRGLGTSVLFAGPSGTGKTLAAEVLASRLRLDLYRIDLSAVVSKYIGETEKNLRRVFDAAEHGGAVLLFDEADALFAKRSEVKDSHDRYANVEVGYLLQRIEAFRGLAVLTTNMKSTIDQAFLRRLRFIVDFPFPDEAHRARIWRRAFPPGAPLVGLDFARLARLNVSGASIRNIALHAAHLAADQAAEGHRAVLCMSHLLVAARREYEKLQQPLTNLETKGWE